MMMPKEHYFLQSANPCCALIGSAAVSIIVRSAAAERGAALRYCRPGCPPRGRRWTTGCQAWRTRPRRWWSRVRSSSRKRSGSWGIEAAPPPAAAAVCEKETMAAGCAGFRTLHWYSAIGILLGCHLNGPPGSQGASTLRTSVDRADVSTIIVVMKMKIAPILFKTSA